MPRDGSNSVRAVVRVRPLLPHELERGDEACCEVPDAHSILIQGGASGSQWRQYAFDACLPTDRSQKQVFQESGVTNLLDAALLGYSSTVLAYGQTGSGKTYTMMGRLGGESAKRDDEKKEDGLVTRSAKSLFRRISSGAPDAEYLVSASFTEIFNAPGAVNECICDLLNPSAGNLQVRHNKKHGFFVSDLSVVDCHCANDVRAVLEAGLHNRRVAAHSLNKDSSRSHALFTLHIDAKEACDASADPDAATRRYGKITFVDLAGSERLKESAAEGHTRKETQAINKSLFTLGQVISQLASGKAQQHVPYRNSKLTQLLQESFGGEALCLMVTCISPATAFAEESLNSLKYATKAMNIHNRPVIRMDERQRLVHDLRAENATLRRELGCYRIKYGELSAEDMQQLEQLDHIIADTSVLDLRRCDSLNVDAAADQAAEQCSRSRSPSRPSSRSAQVERRNSCNSTPGSARRELQAVRQCSKLEVDSSSASARGRGHSEPPRTVSPVPPPAPPEQPPVEAPGPVSTGGGYAMAAAKRRIMAEQRHHPPRRKATQPGKGTSLPPIPRRPGSGGSVISSQAGTVLAAAEVPEVTVNQTPPASCIAAPIPGTRSEVDEAKLAALRRGSGLPRPRSSDRTGEIYQRSPSLDCLSDEEGASAPIVRRVPQRGRAHPKDGGGRSDPVQRTSPPAVPLLRAPPSTKVASTANEPRGQSRLNPEAVQELTRSQIERLDSASGSEWQFDFGGPRRPTTTSVDDVPEGRKSGGGVPTKRSSFTDARMQSRCSTTTSNSSSFSDDRGSSSRSASPNDCLIANQEIMPAFQQASSGKAGKLISAASKTSVASTASGTPAGKGAYRQLSLAELNSQLSSMQMATSALL